MAKRRIQPSDEDIARRAMDVARQISGRLFVSEDSVYLVSGTPAFRKLRACLADISEPPEISAAPTPMDLGFGASQITPLTEELLTSWGRGLQKWRKILSDYEKPRQKTAERRDKYRRWTDEIGRLDHVRRLYAAFHEMDKGRPVSCFSKASRSGESVAELPFILRWLWKWVDDRRPNIGAIAALMSSKNCTDLLKAHDVCLSGLASRLAGLLRRSEGEHVVVLRHALLKLLGKLSGGKLWSDAPTSGDTSVPVGDALGCAGVWELLLDQAGSPRPVFEKLDWSSLYEISFPLDIRSTARVARLLASVAPADRLAKAVLPATELHKQLTRRYLASTAR